MRNELVKHITAEESSSIQWVIQIQTDSQLTMSVIVGTPPSFSACFQREASFVTSRLLSWRTNSFKNGIYSQRKELTPNEMGYKDENNSCFP